MGAGAFGLSAGVMWGAVSGLSRAGFRYRPVLQWTSVNDMAHFACANYVTTLLWSPPAFLMPLLVVNVAGSAATACFYIAAAVIGLIAMIPWAVSASLFAHGSRREEQVVRYASDSGRVVFLLLVPTVAAILALGDHVLMLFGKVYSVQGTKLLQLLTISTLPMAVNFLFFSIWCFRRHVAGVVISSA